MACRFFRPSLCSFDFLRSRADSKTNVNARGHVFSDPDSLSCKRDAKFSCHHGEYKKARIHSPGICRRFPRRKSDDTSRTRRVSATPEERDDRAPLSRASSSLLNGLSAF